MSTRNETVRRRFDLRGQVQGVGFRPHVYRLALAHRLAGHVANNSNGAVIEVEGSATNLDAFERELVGKLPPLAHIAELHKSDLAARGETAFRIRVSEDDSVRRPEVAPDAATCADCLRELFDPTDRRHGYPFINCTNCGPRYSIIRDVPYDRPQTTMAAFTMCSTCQGEYDDPADRRFHAQPNACAACGPMLRLVRLPTASELEQGGGTAAGGNTSGQDAEVWHRLSAGGPTPTQPPPERGRGEEAAGGPTPTQPPPERGRGFDFEPLRHAAELLRDGAILAIKGIGGFHLACRADREDAVRRLRERKLRDGKPLAVMVADVTAARRLCVLSPADEDALASVAAPIVLARQRAGHGLAASVAPECRDFGLMLPYAPVHHLLFTEGLGPLVMTSANLAGLPLTYRDADALRDLADVADAFLLHDREIFRPIDDSVVFTFRDEIVPLRRARGYAPRPIRIAGFEPDGPLACVRDRRILAVGGELKSTVCLLTGGEAIISEHLGDLTQAATYRHFIAAVERLEQLCGFTPDVVACDLHPRYLATEYARRLGLPVISVQHHHAHIASVMAEWGEPGPVVGLSCDGTGYGPDGAVWGCEVLACERCEFERVGHLAYVPLVGGDAAAIQTWRPAAALLHAAFGDEWRERLGQRPHAPASDELDLFAQQMAAGLNAPPTSSLGRVFDAAGFLLGLCGRNRHEAEAAMVLEAAAADEPDVVDPMPYTIEEWEGGLRLSLLPTIRALVAGQDDGQPAQRLAARLHETVARGLVEMAVRAARQGGIGKVAVSGGCFANRRLLSRVTDLLEAGGLTVLYHRHVPCGDGGLALGQALVAAWRAGSANLDTTGRSP